VSVDLSTLARKFMIIEQMLKPQLQCVFV